MNAAQCKVYARHLRYKHRMTMDEYRRMRREQRRRCARSKPRAAEFEAYLAAHAKEDVKLTKEAA